MDNVAELNRQFEANGTLPPGIWDDWLWHSELEEECDPMVLLNRNQLLGLLICRYKAKNPSAAPVAGCDRMSLGEDAMRTWRGLKDSVTNIQLEWPAFLSRLADNPQPRQNLQMVHLLLEQCMARFGALLGKSHPQSLLDDVADAEPAPGPNKELRCLTVGAMRRMVGTFLILYRHLHLLSRCHTLPKAPRDFDVKKHHYEASMDDFYTWHMHFQLPVAAKLNYKHDFPGLYNHVTQVVYFHNSRFERARRIEEDTAPPIHVLPALCQIHPEIPVRFEEDHVDVTQKKGWYWLVVPGRVYLVSPEPKVLYSEDASAMLAYYADAKEKAPEAPQRKRTSQIILL
jgi:hypothetical protein